jgi:stage II sporulation protein Q
MGMDNKFKPSNKKIQQQAWFWPTVYGGIAIIMIAAIFIFSGIGQNKDGGPNPEEVANNNDPDNSVIPVSIENETMKYPIKEEIVASAQIMQEFYDVNAAPELQQKALLVFNQTFTTSEGISISVNSEPFEVLAAMSGEVKEVKVDPFTGNRITIEHSNGFETIYSSVNDILVKEGDNVAQGEQIGTSMENESNPNAGIHLHFKVKKDGQLINPRTLLAF